MHIANDAVALVSGRPIRTSSFHIGLFSGMPLVDLPRPTGIIACTSCRCGSSRGLRTANIG